MAQTVKNSPGMQEIHVRSLGWEDSLEKGIATSFSILAWRIKWTEESGWLQYMDEGLDIEQEESMTPRASQRSLLVSCKFTVFVSKDFLNCMLQTHTYILCSLHSVDST